MKLRALATLFACSLVLSGCSNLISAGREGPIEEDYTTPTTGSAIDDEIIETKANVNISKGSPQVTHARINVTSVNGVVLLTGQVPNEQAKQEAQNIVSQVRKVRKVHNMLSIAPSASLMAQSQDTFITTQIKTKMFGDPLVPSGKVKVITEMGIVYLMGLVTPQVADRAVELVRQVGGVQQVVKVFEYIQ
ncbi:BON domain-containing protein [Balneatrix alpica]|uniref:BON domain-containing protein n=1 Tax=Balneatrix alpica TaxID=75684 RepID=A0ABV5Z8W7_9GAMM|nr:BON domain-containing protein [Balneatrix alpica]